MSVTRRIRALKDFNYRSMFAEKTFVKGEVAVIPFRDVASFQRKLALNLFEGVDDSVLIHTPDIPVIPRPEEAPVEEDVVVPKLNEGEEDKVVTPELSDGVITEVPVVEEKVTEDVLPEDVKEHIEESDAAVEELQQILDGPEVPIHVGEDGSLQGGEAKKETKVGVKTVEEVLEEAPLKLSGNLDKLARKEPERPCYPRR